MFEENRKCSICHATLNNNERNYTVSMKGISYRFCDNCKKNRATEINRIQSEY